jgi:hypothetical protein
MQCTQYNAMQCNAMQCNVVRKSVSGTIFFFFFLKNTKMTKLWSQVSNQDLAKWKSECTDGRRKSFYLPLKWKYHQNVSMYECHGWTDKFQLFQFSFSSVAYSHKSVRHGGPSQKMTDKHKEQTETQIRSEVKNPMAIIKSKHAVLLTLLFSQYAMQCNAIQCTYAMQCTQCKYNARNKCMQCTYAMQCMYGSPSTILFFFF